MEATRKKKTDFFGGRSTTPHPSALFSDVSHVHQGGSGESINKLDVAVITPEKGNNRNHGLTVNINASSNNTTIQPQTPVKKIREARARLFPLASACSSPKMSHSTTPWTK